MSFLETLEAITDLRPGPSDHEHIATCPLCGEVDAMIVNDKRELFACFGCDAQGDEDDFFHYWVVGPPRDGAMAKALSAAICEDPPAARKLVNDALAEKWPEVVRVVANVAPKLAGYLSTATIQLDEEWTPDVGALKVYLTQDEDDGSATLLVLGKGNARTVEHALIRVVGGYEWMLLSEVDFMGGR